MLKLCKCRYWGGWSSSEACRTCVAAFFGDGDGDGGRRQQSALGCG
jgi:hypothetical protein